MVTVGRKRLFAVSCAGMFVFGAILGLPGTVLGQAETVARFGLTLADRGLLIAALFTGLLGGSFLSGPLVHRLGPRAALSLASALVALCLPLLGVAPNGVLAGSALAAIGLTSATINTASNALASALFPTERGRRMNLLAVMVGLGGLALPAATAIAARWVSWPAVVAAAGVLSAVVAALAARLPDPRPPETVVGGAGGSEGGTRPGPLRHLAAQPGFAWFCLLILLAGGSEASLAGWISSYLLVSGFGAAAATWGLSAHWLGLVVSRALFARRVDAAKAAAIERSAVAAALLVLFFAASSTPLVLVVGPFVIGVAMALVMPTALALAGERFAGSAGVLFGALLTLAQVGGIVLPAAIGFVAERAGVAIGLGVPVFAYAAVAVVVRRVSSPVSACHAMGDDLPRDGG